ncbi:DUF1330 domain-containing protein [Levilinea saccharolytica]|uniref:hypothetical protein n=2 Tax=Levilinea saccharolytica TaxID=229921 RepID=UPI0011BD682B|nr:hypothetical protein [Levilinea saccharolytica]
MIAKRLWLVLPIILLFGCSQRNETKCTMESLLLTCANYPGGCVEDEASSPLPEEPNRSAARYLYRGKTPAHHVVIEYPSLKRAEQRFDDYQQAIFENSDPSLEEFPITFTNITADEMRCGCTRNEERKVCSFIARYEKIVTFINVDVSDSGFSIHDFHNSISDIEDKVSACYLEDH